MKEATMANRVLITGGAGFIGGALTQRLLDEGYEVCVLDDLSSGSPDAVKDGATLVVGSVTDEALMTGLIADADQCYHLAAIASVQVCQEDLLQSHRTNIAGFVTVLDAARRAKMPPRIVYASSAAVYGATESDCLRETAVARPLSAYGIDKYACELHAKAANRSYNINSVGLRFFNVYGPGQNPSSPYSGVISRFTDAASKNQPLHIYGGGEQTRDFVYIDDVVEALVRVGRAPGQRARVFNVCTGRQSSVTELAAAVKETWRSGSPIIHGPARDGEVRRSCGSPATLAKATGFVPSISLKEGLLRVRGHGR